MKTDELVSLLATNPGTVQRGLPERRFAAALGCGTLAALLLLAFTMGVRTDIADAARLPMFWVKLAFPAALAAAAVLATIRLSRPGARLGRVSIALAAPLVVIWLLSIMSMLNAPSGDYARLMFGNTWLSCPFNISFLSAPAFVMLFWALRELAPTRLALAGAAAGFVAGAVGALAYSLYCSEMAAPFIGTWYVLGMLIPAALGAVLGPRLLRW